MVKFQIGKSTEDHRTPCDFFEGMDGWLGPFDIDVAASFENAKCVNFRSKEDSGLLGDWHGATKAWVNPPYNDWANWVVKALEQIERGYIESATFLIPPRVDTQAFHQLILPNASLIGFVNGRLNFTGPHQLEDGTSPDPSMIVHFDNKKKKGITWCAISTLGEFEGSY